MSIRKFATLALIFALVLPTLMGSQEELDATVLLREERVEIAPDGTLTKTVHHRVEIKSERGKKLYADITIPYWTETESVQLGRCYTTTNGERYEVTPDAIRDVTSPLVSSAIMYADLHQIIISMPRVRVGSLVDYEYMLTISPLTPNVYWDSCSFSEPGGQVNVDHATYTVLVPEGVQINAGEHRVPPAEVTVSEEGNIYTWAADDIPPPPSEALLPDPLELRAWVSISSFADWADVGAWYADLCESYDVYGLDPGVEGFIDDLTKTASTKEQRIDAIYRWVADSIRYVAIIPGLERFKPHPGQDVFVKEYGDCKDQATLLCAMLRTAGIEAYPALLGTMGCPELEDKPPSPGWLAHTIVAVPTQEGYIYLDPTSDVTPYPRLPYMDKDCDVLIVKDQGVLARTPPVSLDDNTNRLVCHLKIGADGSVGGEGTYTCKGLLAETINTVDKLLTGQAKENWEKTLIQQILVVFAPGIEVKDCEYNLTLEETKVNFDFALRGARVGRLMVIDLPLLKLTRATEAGVPETREYPVKLIGELDECEIYIELEEGVKIAELPEGTVIECPWGAFTCEVKEGRIRSRLALTPSMVVPPEDYAEYTTWREQIIEYNPALIVQLTP